jgi:hypothetical protein
VGGAALCIGVACEVASPTAAAFSIVIPTGGPADGNSIQINILEGNIFNPQFQILSGNVSDNSTVGSIAIGRGNDRMASASRNTAIVLGGGAGTGNTTQINILSFNVFNPQFSLFGPNISNNSTISNVALDNGNNSSAPVTSTPGVGVIIGGAVGNGNTVQISVFSGNIINPQLNLFGPNISNNSTVVNVAAGNGNNSSTEVDSSSWFGTTLLGGLKGNGNTGQLAVVAANVLNPQLSFGDGNISNNSTSANVAFVNGNTSRTVVASTAGLRNNTVLGITGNGNTTQLAAGSGNALNAQGNVEVGVVSQASSDTPASAVSPGEQLQSFRAGSVSLFSSNRAPSGFQLQGSRATTVNSSSSNRKVSASQLQSQPGPSGTGPDSSTTNTGTPGRPGD